MTTQKDKARVSAIIEDMGGPAALARTLSTSKKHLSTALVSNWTYRGDIPRRYWQQIIRESGGLVTAARLAGVVE